MDRVRKILDNADFQRHLRLVAEAEAQRIYCKHDYNHAISVARLAYLLALEQGSGLAKHLIYAAGLLHDLGRWVEYGSGEDHSLVSARFAEPILQSIGFDESEKSIVIEGIREHRVPGESQLGKFLAKADDLSRDCLGCLSRATCYKAEQMVELHSQLEL